MSSLAALAHAAHEPALAVTEGRRGEVFAQQFPGDGIVHVWPATSLAQFLVEHPSLRAFGPGVRRIAPCFRPARTTPFRRPPPSLHSACTNCSTRALTPPRCSRSRRCTSRRARPRRRSPPAAWGSCRSDARRRHRPRRAHHAGPRARRPRQGEIAHLEAPRTFPGGGGGLAFFQLANGPGEAHFFTALGNDDAARDVHARLLQTGARIHAAHREAPQTRDLVLVDADGERTIVVVGEPLHPEKRDALPWELLATCDAAYFTAQDLAALQAARAARVLVVTARRFEALQAAGAHPDVIVGSKHDARENRPLQRARTRTPSAALVLTAGKDGGDIDTAQGVQRWSVPPVHQRLCTAWAICRGGAGVVPRARARRAGGVRAGEPSWRGGARRGRTGRCAAASGVTRGAIPRRLAPMRKLKVAIAGATRAVGREMLRVLEDRDFPVADLVPLASERSEGADHRVQRRRD